MLYAVITLIVLHSVDGREIAINPDNIASMHTAMVGEPNKLITEQANCVIMTTDSKYVSVRETCEEVRKKAEGRLF